MSADSRENKPAERVHQLMHHLMDIVPILITMPPETRSRLMGQLHRFHPRFSPRLIAEPPTMHRIASMLCGDPKPTMGELSKELSLPPSTVSRIVSMLVEEGLAKRLPDAEDGRVVRVGLTDTGEEIYEAMVGHGVRNAQRILDCLTPEEQVILLTLLGKVAANLKEDT